MTTAAVPAAVTLESQPCPLGCEPNDSTVFTGRDRLHDLPGEFRVVRCQTCGLSRTNPRPTPDTIGFYYPDHYGPYQTTKISRTARPAPVKQRYARWRPNLNTQNCPRLPLRAGCLKSAAPPATFYTVWPGKGGRSRGLNFPPARRLHHPGY